MMRNVGIYAIHADKTFRDRPLTSGDGLVFSSMAYGDLPPIDGPVPTPIIDYVGTDCRPIYQACALSKRFADLKIIRQKTIFSETPHCQFSGTAFLFDEDKIFIGFRGTDETVTGWLEDFDIIRYRELPSQRFGKEFLNEIARDYPCMDIYLGGHSKGGNVAVYAAAFCDKVYKERIKTIYCYDGPGFLPEIRGKKEYRDILPKVEKYVPKMSFFGMMLAGNEPVIAAKCRRFWFLQHDHYSWDIDEEGKIADGVKIGFLAQKTQKLFQKIIGCLSPEERNMFVDISERALLHAKVTSMYAMSLHCVLEILFYLLRINNPAEKKFARWIRRELLLGIFFPV